MVPSRKGGGTMRLLVARGGATVRPLICSTTKEGKWLTKPRAKDKLATTPKVVSLCSSQWNKGVQQVQLGTNLNSARLELVYHMIRIVAQSSRRKATQ